MELGQHHGALTPSEGGDSQSTHRIGNNAGLESRAQRMAPVIHPNPRCLPGMPDPLDPVPTLGYPWAFPDLRDYSDHESITSSSGRASFATMSSLDSSTGMHSHIARLRVSQNSTTQRKRLNDVKYLFEELQSVLPSLPKGAGESEILTRAIEHIRKQGKSNQSSKGHELECKLQDAKIELQVVNCQVKSLEQQNKQLTALRDELEKQIQAAKMTIKELGGGFNPLLEGVGGTYSANEVQQHQKSSCKITDDGITRKTPRLNLQPTEISQQPVLRKLACPYYQRNPQKHLIWKSCSGPGFESVHRLKEHLYRRHALPSHCTRCYQTFKSDEERDCHLRQSTVCDIQESKPIEGFNKIQEGKIRSRKRTATNEIEKWQGIYRILFPDDDEKAMPSPYCNAVDFNSDTNLSRFRQDELSKYERYLCRNLPRLIRDELRLRVQQKSLDIEDALHLQLIEVVCNCQVKAFEHYHVSNIALLDERSSVAETEAGDFCPEISTAETSPMVSPTTTGFPGNTLVGTLQYASFDMHDPAPFLYSPFFASSGQNDFPDSGCRPEPWSFNAGNENPAC